MATFSLDRIWRFIVGDRRDKRVVLREAGFADESAAAEWAAGLFTDEATELDRIRRVRQERPDLSLSMARYIVQQYQVRNP